MTEKKTDESKAVRLALGPASWRVDHFDPSIKGVPVLTQDFADVPADQEEAVRAKARDNGLSIRREG